MHHRYREFHAFAAELSHDAAAGAASAPFPPKTWLPDVTPPFLEARRAALEAWLHALLRRTGTCSERCVRTFLELDGGATPRISLVPPPPSAPAAAAR